MLPSRATAERCTAAVFAPYGSAWGQALGPGLEAAGYEPRWVNRSGWEWHPDEAEVDLAVFTTMRGRQGQIRERYQQAGVQCLATDLPHLRGDHDQRRVHPCDHAWLPASAPSDRLEALSVEVHPERAIRDGHVVILGQAPGDSAHGMSQGQITEWAADVVAACREQVPGRELVWRPHPRTVWEVPGVDRCVDSRREGLLETLAGASVVCTYNSTAGLEAIIAGYPVAAWGRACYSVLTVHAQGLAGAEVAPRCAVRSFLSRVAYTQWSFEEIRAGQPFFFLREMVEAA